MIVFIFIFTVLLAALLHELGHLITLSLFGCRVHIKIMAAGIAIKKDGGTFSYVTDAVIYASGPLMNVITFILFRGADSGTLSLLSSVSLALALINLIPVKGLDGWGLVLSLISLFSNHTAALRICEIISLLFTASIFILSLVLLLEGEPNFSLFTLYSWLFYNNYVKIQKNT